MLSIQARRALKTARLALQRIGPSATISDVFMAINQGKMFLGGFTETYVEYRPWEATHSSFFMPAELTQGIMVRKPYDAQPALGVVSVMPVGRYVWDDNAMSESDWNQIDGYRALRTYGFGHASALKLSTTGAGTCRRHRYLALLTSPDVRSISKEDVAVLELLQPIVREAVDRIALPTHMKSPMFMQIMEEQAVGMVSYSADHKLRESNTFAHVLPPPERDKPGGRARHDEEKPRSWQNEIVDTTRATRKLQH